MGEVAEAYGGCRTRIRELVGQLDDETVATNVPACPEWSVHDVVAHVAGVVDDALAGRLDGVATEPWTAAQVEARRDRTVTEILAEWDARAPAFEGLLDQIGEPGRQAVADVVTHEHDIRGALAQPGARDSAAVAIAAGFCAQGLVAAAAAHGVALRVCTDGHHEWGAEQPAMTLTAAPFELLRAITGRRSLEQLRAMKWDRDPEGVLPAFSFGPFRPAAAAIDE